MATRTKPDDGIAAGGSIWVVDRVGGSSDDNMGVVHRIDTSTREVTDVIDVGQQALELREIQPGTEESPQKGERSRSVVLMS